MTTDAQTYTFAYVLHIAATPAQVWEALTDGDYVERYWSGRRIESDWKVGSPVEHFNPDGSLDTQGEVLHSDFPTALCYSWYDADDPASVMLPEQVIWQIGRSGPTTVVLSLQHSGLSADAVQSVGRGWPAVLSSMKSLLERGEPLAFDG